MISNKRERERENRFRFLVVFLLLILFTLSACRQVVIVPLPPVTDNSYVLTLQIKIQDYEPYVYETITSAKVPNLPEMEGLKALGWFDEDDNEIMTGSTIRKDMVLTAKYIAADSSTIIYNPTDETQSSLQDILKDNDISVLYLPSGSFDNLEDSSTNDFTINHGMSIIGGGSSPVSFAEGRAVSYTDTGATIIDAGLTIDTAERVTLKNVYITKTQGSDSLSIKNATGLEHFDLLVENSVIIPPTDVRGIQAYSGPQSADVTLRNSYISIDTSSTSQYRIGMNFVMPENEDDTELNLKIENSTISVDNSSGGAYGIGINIESADIVNIDISNSSIAEDGHGYGVRLYGCGINEAGAKSTVTINDSVLSGWYAYYIQSNSQDIDSILNNTTLIGTSCERDTTYTGSTLAIDSSSECSITVNGGKIEAHNKYAGQNLFSVYYFDNDYSPAGNSVDISSSTDLIYSTDFIIGKTEPNKKLRLGDIQNIAAVYDSSGNEIENAVDNLEVNTAEIQAWNNLEILKPEDYVLGEFIVETSTNLHVPDLPGRPDGSETYDIDTLSYMAIPEEGILVSTADGTEIFETIDDLIDFLNTTTEDNINIYLSGLWSISESMSLNSDKQIKIHGNALKPAIISGLTISQETIDNISIDKYVTIK